MSAINGDKSRFHRERKEKIARRARNRARFHSQAESAKSAPSAAGSKPKVVSA